jgi:hypothetical protein
VGRLAKRSLIWLTVALSACGRSQEPAPAPATPPQARVAADLAPRAPARREGIVVVPGARIEGLTLGSSADAIRAQPGRWGERRLSADNIELVSDPYRVVVDADGASSLELTLPQAKRDVWIGDRILTREFRLEDARPMFSECGVVEHDEGGDRVSCFGEGLTLKRAASRLGEPPAPVVLQVTRSLAEGC